MHVRANKLKEIFNGRKCLVMLKGSRGGIRQQSRYEVAMGCGRYKELLPFGVILQTHYNEERKQKAPTN